MLFSITHHPLFPRDILKWIVRRSGIWLCRIALPKIPQYFIHTWQVDLCLRANRSERWRRRSSSLTCDFLPCGRSRWRSNLLSLLGCSCVHGRHGNVIDIMGEPASMRAHSCVPCVNTVLTTTSGLWFSFILAPRWRILYGRYLQTRSTSFKIMTILEYFLSFKE